MAIAVNVIKAPIQANLLPAAFITVPTTPFRACIPRAYSPIINGMLQMKRKRIQTTINAPPPSSLPFCATILGKRQMFPVPIAIPSALNKKPYRVENRCVEVDC